MATKKSTASKPARVAAKPMTEAQKQLYEQLLKVRASKTVELKPCPLLKESITDADGEVTPFRLRYYQVQGAYHMMAVSRMVLGDDMGVGKTIQVIGALARVWLQLPEIKPIVVANRSALYQWASEIKKFTNGIRPIVVGDPKYLRKGEAPVEGRIRAYEDWATSTDRTVLILNYAILVRDWNHGAFQPPEADGKTAKVAVKPGLLNEVTNRFGSKLFVVYDEAQNFKGGPATKVWEICRFLSDKAGRVYGLTGTLLENNLIEGYWIYKVIRPDLFGLKTQFLEEFCVTIMKKMGKAWIPLIKGYKNLDRFREIIDPFFLGRKKQVISDELPSLISREIDCRLSEAEDAKYAEALTGILELGDGSVRDFEKHKALVSLMYCQRIVDSLALLRFQEDSELDIGFPFTTDKIPAGPFSKEEAFLDLLQGDLAGEKVIVFTRFGGVVDRLTDILKKAKIKSVRVTGKESATAREKAKLEFQDTKNDTQVIFITAAGSESLNLQTASVMIFFDMPWSYGKYLQTLGRMIRLGSKHKGVVVYHLQALRADGRKTIDHHTLKLVLKKKDLIDKVLGEAVGLNFDTSEGTADMKALLQMMKEAA